MRKSQTWIGLALLLLVGPVQADRETRARHVQNNQDLATADRSRGLRVLDQKAVQKWATAEPLLIFSAQKGVTQLFLAVSSLPRSDFWPWRRLLAEAHRRGLSVYAWAEGKDWVARPEKGRQHVDLIAGFNRQVGPSERFDGLLYDIPLPEVHRLQGNASPEKDGSPEAVATVGRYLDLLASLCQRQREAAARFSRGLGVTFASGWEAALSWQGAEKPLYQHVLDTVDFALLDCQADTAPAFIEAAREEIVYADGVGKRVWVLFDTSHPLKDRTATFYDEDEWTLETVLHDLLAEFPMDRGLGGVVIHHYHAYQALPARRPPEERVGVAAPGPSE